LLSLLSFEEYSIQELTMRSDFTNSFINERYAYSLHPWDVRVQAYNTSKIYLQNTSQTLKPSSEETIRIIITILLDKQFISYISIICTE
jgi:hypothetical protein